MMTKISAGEAVYLLYDFEDAAVCNDPEKACFYVKFKGE
jgi:hypothetical protein